MASERRDPTAYVAVYLILLRDEQVVLLRRSNTGYEDGNYSLIAGHVERDERATQAVCREAAEEAGIQLQETDVKMQGVLHRRGPDDRIYIDFFFVAEHWEGKVYNAEPDKCDDLSWFPLADLPTNTIPYVREAIENLSNPLPSFSEIGW